MNFRFRVLLTLTSFCPWSLYLLLIWPYINWQVIAGATGVGTFFLWNLGANVARDEKLREMITLYQDSHNASRFERLFHPKYIYGFIIYGSGLGAFAGMNLSAAYNVYYDLPFKYGGILSG
jgi:hypothetical protein